MELWAAETGKEYMFGDSTSLALKLEMQLYFFSDYSSLL